MMRTEPITKNDRVKLEPSPPIADSEDERGLRLLAVQQLERVRSFKLHVGVFIVGMIAIAGAWVLTEYQNADGWPDRFSDSGGPGTWNPWFFWVLLVWGLILAYHGLKTYFRRPPTKAEVEREIERLKSRG